MNGEATLCKHCHQPIKLHEYPAWNFRVWSHVNGGLACDLTATPE